MPAQAALFCGRYYKRSSNLCRSYVYPPFPTLSRVVSLLGCEFLNYWKVGRVGLAQCVLRFSGMSSGACDDPMAFMAWLPSCGTEPRLGHGKRWGCCHCCQVITASRLWTAPMSSHSLRLQGARAGASPSIFRGAPRHATPRRTARFERIPSPRHSLPRGKRQ